MSAPAPIDHFDDRPDNTDGQLTVKFIANKTQKRFIESTAKADLFACRAGEGKSTALVWACYWQTLNNPGCRSAIIRDTWENCRATTQKEFFYWFGAFGHYIKGEKTFTWKARGMEGEVAFIGADTEEDLDRLHSLNLGACFMDEPAPGQVGGGIDESIFNFILATRLRQKGMKHRPMKLAVNNPDESHWTYKRFVDDPDRGFVCWQPADAENEQNLPDGYYDDMEEIYEKAGRHDLARRYAKGTFGFQQKGVPVCPDWSDDLHLASGLEPVDGYPLRLGWDFGGDPTCAITQQDSLGHWRFLDAFTVPQSGVAELIEDLVKPRLIERYNGLLWEHTGDPMGKMREQSDHRNSAIKVIKNELGGAWFPGPAGSPKLRIEPMNSVLRKQTGGVGIVQVDRRHAKIIWHSLRGGWHYKKFKDGRISENPAKDEHSHPGDVCGYLAARYYPLAGSNKANRSRVGLQKPPRYFAKSNLNRTGPLGFEQPGRRLPPEAQVIEENTHG